MENKEKEFNEEQQKSIAHDSGPLLIVAGAGTGKTTVLIERLNYLIKNNLAKPEEILITTFTEKGAGEMEERADRLLPYGYVDLWIHTFHGFCERLLREHALDIGLANNFKLLTQTEQWILVRKNLDKFDLDYYRPLGKPAKFISELVKHFSRLKDEDIQPAEYLKYAEELKQNADNMLSGLDKKKGRIKIAEAGEGDDLEAARIIELANAYQVYNQLLLKENYLDFGDLIRYTLKLFRERPNILEYYRRKFKYLMVDEFQDTNWAQYELIKMLAKPKNNLVVVGDDDQSIYKFRGASLSNIMQFRDDYPRAEKTVLTKNYRSGQEILDKAYHFIAHNNPDRLEIKLKIDKKLRAQKKIEAVAKHLSFLTEAEETGGVADKIEELYKENKESLWSDFAILVRANDLADKFTAELTRRGLPNQFVSLRGLYFKPIILDVLAYLRLLDNYHESSALYRVLNMEIFKVGHADIVIINKFARRKVWSVFEALNNAAAIAEISPEAVKNINKLLSLIKRHSLLAQTAKVSKIFLEFMRDTGLARLSHDEHREIFNYLNQFYQKIKNFEDTLPDSKLKDFMEMINLELEAGETGGLRPDFEDAETIKIMTVHTAKGLEFRYVFVVNLVDKRFPSVGRSDKIAIPDALVREKLPAGDTHIEEERRLFYVALTRAKEGLFLTSARDYGGARERRASKFLEEAGFQTDQISDKVERKENELQRALAGHNQEMAKKIKYDLPAKFSFSQLEAYANCPLQYKFSFLLKIPTPEKISYIFGRLLHDTLRDFFLPLTAEKKKQANLFAAGEKENPAKPALEDLLLIYKKNWRSDWYESEKEREDYKKLGQEILKKFYAACETAGWPKVLFLEKKFTVKIDEFIIKGAIDRLDRLPDGSLEIIDYKTTVAKEVGYQEKKQLLLYKIAAEEIFKEPVSVLSYYYLKSGEKVSFAAKEKDLEKLKNWVAETIKEIKAGNFMPGRNPLCEYCDFRDICEFRKM